MEPSNQLNWYQPQASSQVQTLATTDTTLAQQTSNAVTHYNRNDPTLFQDARDVQIHGGAFTVNQGSSIVNTTHIHQYGLNPEYTRVLTAQRKAKVLASMPTNDFALYHQDIVDARAPNTGDIFRRSVPLRDWIKSVGGRLWFMGGPGTGKTYLASVVIQELLEMLNDTTQTIAVAFAYLKFSAQLRTWEVIVALIRQLVESTDNEKVVILLDNAFVNHRNRNTRPPLSDLVTLLGKVLEEFDKRFLGIDGLDEMLPDRQVKLIDILLSLDANILIFSRRLPLLKARLEKQRIEKPVFIDVVASSDDLDAFIAHIINMTPGFAELLGDDEFRAQVIERLKEKAGGMFLHASLHMDALRLCVSKQHILEEIDRCPTEIVDLYRGTLSRILKTERGFRLTLAVRAIVWVLNARRILTMDELQHAVAVAPDTFKIEKSRLVSADHILAICHGLVVVEGRSRQARLAHYTAYEMLPHLMAELTEYFGSYDPHNPITRTCIARLIDCQMHESTVQAIGQLRSTFDANPLLEYAHSHVSHHFHLAPPSTQAVLQPLLADFVSRCKAYPLGEDPDPPGSGPIIVHRLNPLHVATLFDFPEFLSSILSRGAVNVNSTSEQGDQRVGWTSLMLASIEGCSRIVDHLLSQTAVDVNKTEGRFGNSPLIMATRRAHLPIVEMLLRHQDLDVNLRNAEGWTALLVASSKGYHGIVEVLLKAPGIQPNLTLVKTGQSALNVAATRGHVQVVKLLVEFSDTDVTLMDLDNRTALMNASFNGHDEVVQILLLRHTSVPRSRSHNVLSPNHSAHTAHTRGGHTVVEQYVDVQQPAPASLSEYQDDGAALLSAAYRGSNVIIQSLLGSRRVDANFTDLNGQTALMIAACYEREATVQLLLSFPQTNVNAVSNDGSSALIMAAARNYNNIIGMLLACRNIDANLANNEGRSALMTTADEGNLGSVNVLLSFTRINVNQADARGRTALITACRHLYCLNVVRDLLAHPATDPNLADEDGCSPLMVACNHGYIDIIQVLLATPGIDVNQRHARLDWSAFMLAARLGKTAVIDALYRHSVPDVNTVDGMGWSALMLAAFEGDIDTVQYLLHIPHLDVNLLSNNGCSALMLAILGLGDSETQRYCVVQALLADSKTDINLVNSEGWSALTVAFFSPDSRSANIFGLILNTPGIDASCIEEGGSLAPVVTYFRDWDQENIYL